jgi:hypothetical protein
MPKKVPTNNKQLNKDRALLSKMLKAKYNRFPPPFDANPVFTRKFRYQAQASESKDGDYITMASLQNLQFIQDNTQSAGMGYFSAVRLRRVEIWANASSSNTMNSISLDWLSNDAPNKQIAATGNSIDPAHLDLKPPKLSAAGRWYAGQLLAQNTPTSIVASTPYAFAIQTSAAGAICEITLDFTLFDYDTLNNPFAVTSTGSAQTYSLVTNSYLDNTSVSLGNGTKNWLVQHMVNVSPGYIVSW